MLTIADLDSCEMLYVWNISEPEDNSLRLELAENQDATRREKARLFEVIWPVYLTYQVMLERASGGPDPYEQKSGRIFVRYSRSRYRDYLESDPGIRTRYFEDFEAFGPLEHWGIYCLNHAIDVVAPGEPKIELLESPWENAFDVRQRFEEQLKTNREESIAQTRRGKLKKL